MSDRQDHNSISLLDGLRKSYKLGQKDHHGRVSKEADRIWALLVEGSRRSAARGLSSFSKTVDLYRLMVQNVDSDLLISTLESKALRENLKLERRRRGGTDIEFTLYGWGS